MKRSFFSFLAFVVLAIFISSCTDNEPTGSNSTEAVESNSNSEQTKKGSEYPPLPEKVAQSDLQNLDRTTSKLADRKGKVLLLNMWATWCGYCRTEMPLLVKMQDRHRDAGLEIIGLNIDDESIDQVNEFAEEMKLNYTLTWADTKMTYELMKVSNFKGIPQSFLVDRDGNLRAVFKGADPSNLKKMENLVAEVVSE